LRERALYLINIESDGAVIRTKVTRSLPVTDSPLTDVITSLLAGPMPEERRRGLISLIPEGTRIMSATVRGSTAYINFNEEFQFNTYGVEGYAAALRQIVWTATEFSNVRDVQVLIEGRRVDYLGEGVWIGSPLSREML
jgi:spore germination protein GerM